MATFLGSISLKPYATIKGKARAAQRHHMETLMRELLVDLEAGAIDGGGGLYIRSASSTTMKTLV